MIRSPFFYVGDKYKLMPQLKTLFPNDIDLYVEPFFGGGSSFLNVEASRYAVNDIDCNIIDLHNFLLSYCDRKDLFFDEIFATIKKYNLSCSYLCNDVPLDLRKKYPKTYFAKFNKSGYEKMKSDFNKNKSNLLLLYLLLIYGFNHMIRFNMSGDFNLPVGNVDFNKNVYKALNDYFDINRTRQITLSNNDFETFVNNLSLNQKSFIYFDPPYFISQSEYNKLWTEDDENRLYSFLDLLNEKGYRFGITNLLCHKGKTNTLFKQFSEKYRSVHIKSNYISYNDNTVKEESCELFVYNY